MTTDHGHWLFTTSQIFGSSYSIESSANRFTKRYNPEPTCKIKNLKSSGVYKPIIVTKDCRQNMEAGFRQLNSICSLLPSTWRELAGVRILFLIGLYCLLSTHVSSASIQFPNGCVRSNYSAQEQDTILSINCSSVGLHVLELNASAPNEYSLNYTGSTNASQPMMEYHFEPKIYYLDLSHNNLTMVKPDVQGDACCLNRTIQVKVLILSFNAISQIEAGHLAAYADVTHLDLSHNAIKWVDEDAFIGLEAVTQLNLSYNNIDDLANATFQSLTSLRILDLSYNNMHTFPLDRLPVLSSLQYLYLNNNHLQSVTNSVQGLVPNLQNLGFLDLSNNNITKIPSGAFQMLSSLRTLNVSNNSIQEVSGHILKGLNNLEDLILDQNCILAISTPIFQNMSLIRLSIANMPDLTNISHDAFQGLTNLIYLNLSHNLQLTFLQPNLFTALAKLETLDISNSSLAEVSWITFQKNKNLHKVFISNNPLSCSCTNAWLAIEASKNHTRFVNAYSLYCLSENGIQTVMHNASFSCEDITIHNSSSTISAKLGSQLLFKCQHDTKDPGIVKWTTPSGNIFYQHHFHPDASQHLLTPEDIQPGSDYHQGHYWHQTSSYYPELASSDTRVSILSDGSLFIDYMLRTDAGLYKCQISNAQYNDTITVNLFAECAIGNYVQIFSYIVGLICALTFFTLNLIYVIISWIARRLVNKRRREIIRQMLENLNGYKSTQIARIHENYTHQLNRVRNQYHVQCDRLHKNYTSQVTRVKRGCSNQVEKVRDNYNSKLTQLREYSTNQILQIRERTNCQIVRIRDYGTSQLDKLRETYKLQQQHVLKLLDTMNLENCRNIVETECMKAESMMYDIDLLGDDDRTDSPSSPADSEYSTAVSSPSSSLDDPENAGLRRDMSQKHRELSTDSSETSGAIREVQTTIDLEIRAPRNDADSWKYDLDSQYEINQGSEYLMNIYCPRDELLLQLHTESTLPVSSAHSQADAADVTLPTLNLRQDHFRANSPERKLVLSHKKSDSDVNSDGLYMTPEASPTKVWPETRRPPLVESPTKVWAESRRPPLEASPTKVWSEASRSTEASPTKIWSETRRPPIHTSPTKVWPENRSPQTFKHSEKDDRSQRNKELNNANITEENDRLNESIV